MSKESIVRFARDPDFWNSPTSRLAARVAQYLLGQEVDPEVVEEVTVIIFDNINKDDVVVAERTG